MSICADRSTVIMPEAVAVHGNLMWHIRGDSACLTCLLVVALLGDAVSSAFQSNASLVFLSAPMLFFSRTADVLCVDGTA